MNRLYDAAIIGAGVAGSTLALLLARAGWSVVVVDKDVFPRRKVCGECIAAGNIELLDHLGLGPAFSSMAGAELRSMELWVGSRRVRADLPPASGSRPWGRALGREHLDAMLLDQARRAGAEVRQPRSARSFEPSEDTDARGDRDFAAGVATRQQGSWTLTLSGERHRPETLRARTVVLAHGAWGKPLGPSAHSKPPHRAGDLFAFKANFEGTRLPSGVLPVFAFSGGYGGMVIADHGRATLAFCVRRDVLEELRQRHPGASAAEAGLQHLVRTCAGIRDVLDGATRDAAWLAAGPIRPGMRAADPRSGVFRVGNAAGEAHPIIGEGISMALQGAVLLSRHLLAGGARRDAHAWQAAGTAYARDWRQNFSARIRMAALCAHAAMRPALAPVLLPLLQRRPSLLTSGARLAAKARRPLLPDMRVVPSRDIARPPSHPSSIQQKEPV